MNRTVLLFCLQGWKKSAVLKKLERAPHDGLVFQMDE